MSTRRLSIALLVLGITGAAASDSASACCLTDWLFGRTATPYSAGYAPYGASYTPIGSPQILTTPIGSTPYSAGYAPNYPANYASGYTALPLTPPAYSSGVFQAQRPAYYDNPSVYTGLPTAANAQAAYSVPITSNYRGGMAASAGNIGAANTYPNSAYSSGMPINSSYASPYSANYQSAAPASMLPTTQVTPLFPPQQQPVRSGLSRFFGSIFGTNYNSSYYRAPVTYYRPVTSVDPMLGTTVTVQRPCTSTITQVQRTPYSSMLATQPAPIYGQPSSDCQTQPGMYGPSGYSQVNPYGQQAIGGVGQASAIGTSPSQFTVPIPSTAPSLPSDYGYGNSNQPTVSPLTGSPSDPRPQSGAGDLAPIDQPRLDSYQRSETSSRQDYDSDYAPAPPSYSAPSYSAPNYLDPQPSAAPTPTETQPREAAPKSYWQLQDADDSTAMIRAETQPRATATAPRFSAPRDPASLTLPSFTAAEPIRAPGNEPSPFESLDATRSGVSRANFEAPPLPPARSYPPADANSASSRSKWQGTPAREVALVRNETTRNENAVRPAAAAPKPKAEPKRDSRWFTVQP
ncbi:hypothetical protein [Rubripirellula reticaptiva]|uniref:Uncharacterized protein n=1 Tax=Rubripirellula reticaptiva TaxID=2528013 RepID=A0A5C6EGH9_9BACT|nr:hypothetical protein [Rubripirellula reticaptiva]TWU47908.1 hypothetical protein Poly59_47520 [Rubripirellula reticaptiva]